MTQQQLKTRRETEHSACMALKGIADAIKELRIISDAETDEIMRGLLILDVRLLKYYFALCNKED